MGLAEIRKLKEQALLPKTKKVYQIPKKSAKKIAMEKLEQKVEIVKPKKAGWFDLKQDNGVKAGVGILSQAIENNIPYDINKWFFDRRFEMKGVCKHCGGKSCKDDDKYYKFSICHIFPKAYFKSIATHPDNWIELCFWSNNCHGNMDNKTLDLTEMNCWAEIVEKATRIYLSIAKEERRRIPSILLEYIKTEL